MPLGTLDVIEPLALAASWCKELPRPVRLSCAFMSGFKSRRDLRIVVQFTNLNTQ
jgi:hypothetical protein